MEGIKAGREEVLAELWAHHHGGNIIPGLPDDFQQSRKSVGDFIKGHEAARAESPAAVRKFYKQFAEGKGIGRLEPEIKQLAEAKGIGRLEPEIEQTGKFVSRLKNLSHGKTIAGIAAVTVVAGGIGWVALHKEREERKKNLPPER